MCDQDMENREMPQAGAQPTAGASEKTPDVPAASSPAGAEPAAGTEPTAGAEPAVEVKPTAEAGPTAGAEPAARVEPTAGTEPVAGTAEAPADSGGGKSAPTVSPAPAMPAEEAGLPERCKTVQGVMIRILGDRSLNPLLVTFGRSKIQGCLVQGGRTDATPAFLKSMELLEEGGFREDEKGMPLSSLLLPMDAIALESGQTGLIVEADLRKYTRGYAWLCAPGTGSMTGAMRALRQFAETARVLWGKGWVLNAGDGERLWFHAGYGVFHLICDGQSAVRAEELVQEKNLKNPLRAVSTSVSAIVMHGLLGAWPEWENLSLLEIPEDADRFSFSRDTGEISGSESCLRMWKILPLSIRDAIQGSYEGVGISMELWSAMLQETVDTACPCPICGAELFPASEICPSCGNTTDKSGFLTQWNLEDSRQAGKCQITFGRGFCVHGSMLAPELDGKPYLRLMYNAGTNALGVRNLSNRPWTVYLNGAEKILSPGMVQPIQPGFRIAVSREVQLCFQGYAVPEPQATQG